MAMMIWITIGAVSGLLSLMLVHWMQPGHIFDFIPKRLAKAPSGLSEQELVDFYWDNVKGNFILRMCICEVCLSVYVYTAMFAIFGEATILAWLSGLASCYGVIRYAP